MIRHAVWAIVLVACERRPASAAPDETSAPADEPAVAAEPDEGEPSAPLEEQVLRIDGGMREAEVKAVVEQHFDEIRTCFDAGLAANPQAEIDGAIVVAIRVDAAGKVSAAQAELNETGDAATEACIVAEVGKWSFPRPKREATIHYPFYLRSY